MAVTPSGRIAARPVLGTVHPPDVIRALQHCRHAFGQPLLLPASIVELKALATRSIRYLPRHPRLLANFFRHTRLSVK